MQQRAAQRAHEEFRGVLPREGQFSNPAALAAIDSQPTIPRHIAAITDDTSASNNAPQPMQAMNSNNMPAYGVPSRPVPDASPQPSTGASVPGNIQGYGYGNRTASGYMVPPTMYNPYAAGIIPPWIQAGFPAVGPGGYPPLHLPPQMNPQLNPMLQQGPRGLGGPQALGSPAGHQPQRSSSRGAQEDIGGVSLLESQLASVSLGIPRTS
jgi:hypothetical protein